MQNPTVSLCIPTHGRTDFLILALESGLNQSRPPDEIVVSDDLGSDETREIVADFNERTSYPVRYTHCISGQSLADNVNHCLQETVCELTLLLHDDDLLMPRAIELLMRPFQENQAVVASYGKQIIISDGGDEQSECSDCLNLTFRRDGYHAGLQADAVLSGIWQQFPNDGYMVKTAVARKVRHQREYCAASEVDFGIRLGELGQFYFVNEYASKYRLSLRSLARGKGSGVGGSAYHSMRIFLRLLMTHPAYEGEIVSKLCYFSPMGIYYATRMEKLEEAISWYFGCYHRRRILTFGGIRRGISLFRAWLKRLASPVRLLKGEPIL
jgi:glycosyltransferase involved in cell wall biosynthesis